MTANPEIPRQASTIILVREHGRGLQVYLLRRSDQSGFFPGSYVFPGGTVGSEDREADLWVRHCDLDWTGVERRLGGALPAGEALVFGVAAVRETFEEAGVLLAGDPLEARAGVEAVWDMRRAGKLSRGWLREWVASDNRRLLLSRLARWAHWVTPEALKPRFDTRFFLALIPRDQECSPDQKETTHGIWLTPEEGLAGNLKGETPLTPPTLVTLQELLPYQSLRALQEEATGRGWGEPRVPRLVPVEKGAVILEPWDPMIGKKNLEFDPATLKTLVLPLGEPFSRIWLYEGIWRPIGV